MCYTFCLLFAYIFVECICRSYVLNIKRSVEMKITYSYVLFLWNVFVYLSLGP
jgi:hypothetical protein